MEEENKQNTPEEAKFWRDKHVMELTPLVNKATAKVMGVDPDNYELIKKGETPENIDKIKIVFGTCYEDIIEVLKYYVQMPEEYYHIISIWILGSYLQQSFESFPYLFLNAMRGSAKTRTLRLISNLAYKSNGHVETGINETTLYRTEKGATLVLDEFENVGKKEKSELRQYLNAAYKKGMSVSRSRKVSAKGNENYVLDKFEPYRPIAMANIWGMEEVLGDRCITLVLEKSSDPSFIKIIEDFSSNQFIKDIKRTLEIIQCSLCSVVTKKNITKTWNNYIKDKYTNYTTTLTPLTPLTTLTTPTTLSSRILEEELFLKIDSAGIDGRNLELYLPLLITSLILNQDIFLKTLEIAKSLVSSKKNDELNESKDVSLFDFVSRNQSYILDFVNVSDLTRQFREFLGNMDDQEDNWLNSKWMGRALKRLNLVLSSRRLARGVEVTINSAKAKEKLKMFKKEEKE